MAEKPRKSHAAARKAKPKPKAAAKPKRKAAAAPRTSARKKATTSGRVADRANRAAKRAKATGATGRHLGALKQGLRDSAIMARVAQGVRYATIAAELRVSVRTVEQVVHDTRALRSPMEMSPMELLEGLARGFELSIGDFEAMAHAFVKDAPGDAIRAKRNANDARRAFAELMAHVGKLPTDLELFRSEMEMQQLAGRMVEVMRGVLAGDTSPQEAYEVFEAITTSPRAVIEGHATEREPVDA